MAEPQQQLGSRRRSHSRSSRSIKALMRRSAISLDKTDSASNSKASSDVPHGTVKPNPADAAVGSSSKPSKDYRAFLKKSRRDLMEAALQCEDPSNQPSIPPLNLALPRISIESIYRHGKHVLRREGGRPSIDMSSYFANDRTLTRRPRPSMSSEQTSSHPFTKSLGRNNRRRKMSQAFMDLELDMVPYDDEEEQEVGGLAEMNLPQELKEDQFLSSLSPTELQQIVAALSASGEETFMADSPARQQQSGYNTNSITSSSTLYPYPPSDTLPREHITQKEVMEALASFGSNPLRASKRSLPTDSGMGSDSNSPRVHTDIAVSLNNTHEQTPHSDSPRPSISLSMINPQLVNRLLQEFLTTERTYVHELSAMVALYIRPLVRAARDWSRLDGQLHARSLGRNVGSNDLEEDAKVVAPSDVPLAFRRVLATVFGNAIEILGLHAGVILPSLKEALENLVADSAAFNTLSRTVNSVKKSESSYGTLGSTRDLKPETLDGADEQKPVQSSPDSITPSDPDAWNERRDMSNETTSIVSGCGGGQLSFKPPTISVSQCVLCGVAEDHAEIADDCCIKIALEFGWMSRLQILAHSPAVVESVPGTNLVDYPVETKLANLFLGLCESGSKLDLNCYKDFLSGLDRSLLLVAEIENLSNLRSSTPSTVTPTARTFSFASRTSSYASMSGSGIANLGGMSSVQDRIRSLKLSERFLSDDVDCNYLQSCAKEWKDLGSQGSATAIVCPTPPNDFVPRPMNYTESAKNPSTTEATASDHSAVGDPTTKPLGEAAKASRPLIRSRHLSRLILNRFSSYEPSATAAGTTNSTTIALTREKSLNPAILPSGAEIVAVEAALGGSSNSTQELSSPRIPSSVHSNSSTKKKLTKRHSFDPKLLFPSKALSPRRKDSADASVNSQAGAAALQQEKEKTPRRRRRMRRNRQLGTEGQPDIDVYVEPVVGTPAPAAGAIAAPAAEPEEKEGRSFASESHALDELARIIASVADDPRKKQIGLGAYLVLPLQRLTRYGILLDRLASALPAEHPSKIAVDKAARGVRSVIEVCNAVRGAVGTPTAMGTQHAMLARLSRQRLSMRATSVTDKDEISARILGAKIKAGEEDERGLKAATLPRKLGNQSAVTNGDEGGPANLEYMKPDEDKKVVGRARSERGLGLGDDEKNTADNLSTFNETAGSSEKLSWLAKVFGGIWRKKS
ncbi:hypothetical protein HDU97_002272 [Phlyctochytrium planicorne]|nr:hypothetical protein HDU97_002272 [Phlyctochytrium planicorne]